MPPIPLNWPGTGLDSLPKPGASTKTNDSGYYLDEMVTAFSTLIERAEARFGYDESSPQSTPIANTVYQSLTNGKGKWATIVTAMIAANAITQFALATGSSSSPSFSSTSYATLEGNTGGTLATSLTSVLPGSDILAFLVASVSESTAGDAFTMALALDGAAEVAEVGMVSKGANLSETVVTFTRFASVAGGTQTVRARGKVSAGTWTQRVTQRHLLMIEVRR